jgi:hypothetical protein
MTQPLSPEHKKQFEEMRKNLLAIGSRESNFIKVELLFYDAITVARTYGDDEKENGLLAAFKELQSNQYQETKALFNKSVQRERVIRRFISGLKGILSAAMKNAFFQPQLT